jgi:CII-binding regulator of phage lambda lysogenization HflD
MVDKSFLDTVVFPFIREGIFQASPMLRWTNGDFIERNMFLDSAGGAKLIDYEFAAFTHFYGEDWIRFEEFSQLSDSVKKRIKNKPFTSENWLSVYFWLRQIACEQKIYVPHYCNANLPIYINNINKILQSNSAFQHSVFFHDRIKINEIGETKHQAQLYVDNGLGFNEKQSILRSITGNEQQVEFDLSNYSNINALRFDPLNERVVLKLKQIKLLTKNKTLKSQFPYTANADYIRDDIMIFNTNDSHIYIDTNNITRPKTVIVQLDYLAWGLEVDKYVNEEKSTLIKIKDEALVRKAEVLQRKDAELQHQAEALRVINETVLRQADELQRKDIEICRLSQELQAAYDELIRKAQEQQVKNAELLKLQAEVFYLHEKIQQRNEQIREIQEKLKNAESLVSYFEHEYKEKEAFIISLNNECINELKEKYATGMTELKTKESNIEKFKQEIEHLKIMNQSLADQEKRKDIFITILENSLSLRLGRGIGKIAKAPMHIFDKRGKG